MSDALVSPFVLVGDPSAAACEGDFCAVPGAGQGDAALESQEPDLSPAEEDSAPAASS